MRSLYLAIPAVLLTILSTVMLFVSGSYWSAGLAIGIVSLVAIYMVKDAIDWKYYLKHPPKLEARDLKILDRIPFYKQLNANDRLKFQQRLSLFMIAHQYKFQPIAGADEDESIEAPHDLKVISSIPAVIYLFDQEDYLIRNIEHIVFYRHPFPSPVFKVLHHSEWNEEDKVLIFSIPHLQKGTIEPFIYFDIGMYEWVRANRTLIASPYSWEDFEKKYLVNQAKLELAIGLPNPDLNAVRQVFDIHSSYLKEL